MTLAGVIAPQVRPDGTESLNVTPPAKPFTSATVIVDVAEEAAFAAAGDDADIVKSRNWNVAVALWISGVLVPVIVAV